MSPRQVLSSFLARPLALQIPASNEADKTKRGGEPHAAQERRDRSNNHASPFRSRNMRRIVTKAYVKEIAPVAANVGTNNQFPKRAIAWFSKTSPMPTRIARSPYERVTTQLITPVMMQSPPTQLSIGSTLTTALVDGSRPEVPPINDGAATGADIQPTSTNNKPNAAHLMASPPLRTDAAQTPERVQQQTPLRRQ